MSQAWQLSRAASLRWERAFERDRHGQEALRQSGRAERMKLSDIFLFMGCAYIIGLTAIAFRAMLTGQDSPNFQHNMRAFRQVYRPRRLIGPGEGAIYLFLILYALCRWAGC